MSNNPYTNFNQPGSGPSAQQPSGFAPKAPAKKPGALEYVFGSEMATKMKSPLVATSLLIAGAVLFAGIVMISYPSSDDAESIPVVKAEAKPIKSKPLETGGARIAHQDSTVFDVLKSPEAQNRPVENLLEQARMEKSGSGAESLEELEQFAKTADKIMSKERGAEGASGFIDLTQPVKSGGESDAIEITASVDEASEPKIMQQLIPDEALGSKDEAAPQQVASVPSVPKTKPRVRELAPAGASPETLAFVRSVLSEDEAAAASSANSIEPASGAASMAAAALSPENQYFVQLSSIRDQANAGSEWQKLQASYPQLEGQGHRVQKAELGERGTFYRVQSGPLSKEDATKLCDSIKAQKPGACLVVR